VRNHPLDLKKEKKGKLLLGPREKERGFSFISGQKKEGGTSKERKGKFFVNRGGGKKKAAFPSQRHRDQERGRKGYLMDIPWKKKRIGERKHN